MNDQNGLNRKVETQRKDLPRQISFLLRLWSADETGCSNWRASLEMPGTGKRIGFASLEQLFIYLIDLSENRMDPQDQGNRGAGTGS